MKLSELAQVVRTLCGEGDGDKPVLITLSERSYGARAYCQVKYVGVGIDWESGQFRIEPEEGLCRKGRAMDDAKDMYLISLPPIKEGAKRKVLCTCPECETHLRKDYKYCPNCGQRVVYNSGAKVLDL